MLPNKPPLVTTFAILFAMSLAAIAATRIQGTFTATQACPAYHSENKQTNPGDVYLMPGAVYTAFQVNNPDNPDWYRVLVPDARPKARWVNSGCGTLGVAGEANLASGGGALTSCSTPGLADSYVLALSWQSAFCELRPDERECQIGDATSYQSTHFTLHGLWPNRAACGTHYGYCGTVQTEARDFCDAPRWISTRRR